MGDLCDVRKAAKANDHRMVLKMRRFQVNFQKRHTEYFTFQQIKTAR